MPWKKTKQSTEDRGYQGIILKQVVRVGFIKRGHLNTDLKEVRE